MPLTSFQREILKLIAAHRNPESHVAGGAVLNRANDSPRYSADLDLFHDVAESVAASAQSDVQLLAESGYGVEWRTQQPYIYRALVRRGNDQVGLDWCFDSAFRFFPVLPDPEFGYCLHRADLATNKMLALANRSEIRDFLDILYLHKTYLALGMLCWAAAGKDPGLTPAFILNYAKKNVRFRDDDLTREQLAQPVHLAELREVWSSACSEAETLFDALPAGDVGCLFLDSEGKPVTPGNSNIHVLIRHRGSLGGAWPRLTPP